MSFEFEGRSGLKFKWEDRQEDDTGIITSAFTIKPTVIGQSADAFNSVIMLYKRTLEIMFKQSVLRTAERALKRKKFDSDSEAHFIVRESLKKYQQYKSGAKRYKPVDDGTKFNVAKKGTIRGGIQRAPGVSTRVGIVTLNILDNKWGNIFAMMDRGGASSPGRYVPVFLEERDEVSQKVHPRKPSKKKERMTEAEFRDRFTGRLNVQPLGRRIYNPGTGHYGFRAKHGVHKGIQARFLINKFLKDADAHFIEGQEQTGLLRGSVQNIAQFINEDPGVNKWFEEESYVAITKTLQLVLDQQGRKQIQEVLDQGLDVIGNFSNLFSSKQELRREFSR